MRDSSADQLSGEELTKALRVNVTGGEIEGRLTDSGLRLWQGIPFAAPPVGELRWRPPQPVLDWDGVLATTEPGPICMQLPGLEGGFYSEELGEMSEDCLTLNVWAPRESTQARLPVLYWIHGGGLTGGAGSRYDGETLVPKGVVLVTVNYRLGGLGFLAHPELSAESGGVSGNQGLLDQIAGLTWVRDNIASFGGDSSNVTIFGESAGALSVSLVQASPLAKGLFHRAIGESGGSFQPMTYLKRATAYSESAEALGVKLAETLEVADLEGLRGADAEAVLAAFSILAPYDKLAIVDGRAIPKEVRDIFAAGEQANVPVMIGSNADEGTTFLPYFQPAFGSGLEGLRAYANNMLPEVVDEVAQVWPAADDSEADISFGHLFADVLFTYPQRAWARGQESVSSPAYLYYFTWKPPIPDSERYGAFHAADVPYVFGSLEMFGAQPTDADQKFSETISDLWVRFARTGNPNGDGFPEWQPYTPDNEVYMELGEEIGAGTDLRLPQVELIDRAFEQRRKG
jgi:para-nitrobenzyl esterase